ncbi:MAG: hypothetical protein EZS28_027485 [Streblomastix strix]|uniref:Uncharacterized protein n=1 Tax=Streblomastix strix TaxID=222440 RepID=A0A5J4V2P1_9EUKA|nr:MAG: hypothetical protein EZS28_027485 [Streblomastix strix]
MGHCLRVRGVKYYLQMSLGSNLYLPIMLQELLKVDGQRLYGEKLMMQIANDPNYISRQVTNWISNNKIETTEWPSNTPDRSHKEQMFHFSRGIFAIASLEALRDLSAHCIVSLSSSEDSSTTKG